MMHYVLPLLLLLVIQITLKITDQIDWSWWLVLWPLYHGLTFLAVIFVIAWLAAPSSKKRRPF
jgi:hypothetical protein